MNLSHITVSTRSKKKNKISDYSSKGGKARWKGISKEERSRIAKINAKKMWDKIKAMRKSHA